MTLYQGGWNHILVYYSRTKFIYRIDFRTCPIAFLQHWKTRLTRTIRAWLCKASIEGPATLACSSNLFTISSSTERDDCKWKKSEILCFFVFQENIKVEVIEKASIAKTDDKMPLYPHSILKKPKEVVGVVKAAKEPDVVAREEPVEPDGDVLDRPAAQPGKT